MRTSRRQPAPLVIDPRWSKYLDTSGFQFRGVPGQSRPTAATATATATSGAHPKDLKDGDLHTLMTSVLLPWQHGITPTRDALLMLKRLAELKA